MNKKLKFTAMVLFFTILIIPAFFGFSTAQAEGGYEINWWTVDGGGGESTGEGYTLKGTIGQPDAGYLEGGEYALHGGFWRKGISTFVEYLISMPLVLR
jgi:hypothetical protein